MSRTVFLCALAVLGAILVDACSPGGARAVPATGAGNTATAAASAVALPPPAPPAGPRAEGDAFEVVLEPPASARAGQPATARVVVRARGSYHVNRDYPMAFRPAPDSTAGLAGERIPLAEGQERTPCAGQAGEACTVSAPLPFTPPAAGEVRLAGTLAFSVCDPDRCLIEKQPLAVTVAVR